MKKSYETPAIWVENRFVIKGEFMMRVSLLQGRMEVNDETTIYIVDGTDSYEEDSGIFGFSGPATKERKDEEWGRVW